MADKARQEVQACEQEIAAIKAQLRGLGSATAAPNRLTVAWIKVEGLADESASSLRLELQLSSPIETAELTEVSADDESKMAKFESVELGLATLTVTASYKDNSSGKKVQLVTRDEASSDLASVFSSMNPMEPQPQYAHDVVVDLVESGKTKETAAKVTLRATFYPTVKDQREELYELLNKTTERKNKAVEELRRLALAQSRGGGAVSKKSPAVSKGFLNKSGASTGDESKGDQTLSDKVVQVYQKYLGETSIVRRVVPVVKNYVIFFGAVVALHFKGQLLALPQPV